MSMSDDVQRAGAPNKEGNGLKNPYASAGAGQNGGKPATGLPGLAAFGQMQTYTPQTAQPRHTEQRQEQQEQAVPVREQHSAPQQEPAYEQPSYEEEPAYEEAAFSEEQGFATDQPAGHEYAFQAEDPYEQDQPFLAEAAPEFMQPDDHRGHAAEAQSFSYQDSEEPQAGQGPELSFNDLTDIYRNGSGDQADEDAAYEFTADDLQSYMSGNGQGGQEDHAREEEEDFDLTKHMSLQPFEARYDQQRPVDLGGYDDEPGEQPFFHPEQQGDADFLGEEEPDAQMPPPRERKSRRALMFASGLIGALALGGALAFAYKMTGSETQIADGSGPPLIKADDSPVKVAPDEPGGKQFAHQNKQIYDRLQGDQKPEVERIVPRQEAVQDAPSAPAAGAAIAAPNDGGPHKVRTLKVMPDGSVVVSAPPSDAAPSAPAQQAPSQQQPMPMQSAQPSIPALPAPGSEMAGVAVTMPPEPQPQADQTTVASVPPGQQQQLAAQPAQQQQLSSETSPAPMPQPKPAAPTRQTASVAPQQQASSGSGYAVQVASRRSQAMALAAFADLQQKYTSLLGDYQPLIQSADLGDKGVWYRLRVGPIGQKAQADDLCNNLKKAGLRSCLVRPL